MWTVPVAALLAHGTNLGIATLAQSLEEFYRKCGGGQLIAEVREDETA